jgi:hypothetical protein
MSLSNFIIGFILQTSIGFLTCWALISYAMNRQSFWIAFLRGNGRLQRARRNMIRAELLYYEADDIFLDDEPKNDHDSSNQRN